MSEPRIDLVRLFQRRKVMDLDALLEAVPGRSRRSLFRDLASVDYLSSFTHGGRYFTLPDFAQWDDDHLWFHREVGFSEAGNLQETICGLVSASIAGLTHGELRDRVRIRVQNTLFGLIRAGRLVREQLHSEFVYLDEDSEVAQRQLEARRRLVEVTWPTRTPSLSVVVEILGEVIRSARPQVDPQQIATQLRSRGVDVTVGEVEATLAAHSGQKKTAGSTSTRSRR